MTEKSIQMYKGSKEGISEIPESEKGCLYYFRKFDD
jgi:hypothetical protein